MRGPAYTIPFTSYDAFVREAEASEELIEVGLHDWSSEARKVKLIPDTIRSRIVSVHGVVLPLEERFRKEHYQVAVFARDLGVPAIIVHPQKIQGTDAERLEAQKKVSQLLYDLEEKTSVRFLLETFKGGNRVYHPSEAVAQGRSIDLDTSHLDSLDCFDLLQQRLEHVGAVHLSEFPPEGQHRPMGVRCEMMLEILYSQNWNGLVCFEYMPEFLEQARSDTAYARLLLEGFNHSRAGDLPQALDSFSDAVTLRDGYLGRYALGNVLIRMEKLAFAVCHFERAVGMHPGHADSHLFLSYAYRALGNDSSATIHEEECKRINPGRVEEFLRSGELPV